MDFWFWLAAGFIAVVFVLCTVSAHREGGWRALAGAVCGDLAPVLLLATLVGVILVLLLVTGGNDGWLLVLGLPLVVGAIGFIAWRFRH